VVWVAVESLRSVMALLISAHRMNSAPDIQRIDGVATLETRVVPDCIWSGAGVTSRFRKTTGPPRLTIKAEVRNQIRSRLAPSTSLITGLEL
jgi:hypothetical protein